MASVTCRPRVEFELDRYVRLRVWDPDEQRDRYLYLHRLTAFAHGKIDALGEPVDIHHRDGDKWNNAPANLEPQPPAYHRRRALDDGARARASIHASSREE